MKIYYDTFSGKVRRFTEKLPYDAQCISEVTDVQEPFVLITYTFGFGEVPKATAQFLAQHGQYLRGVASSGNRIWGANFAKSADTIAEQWKVPKLLKFEMAGTEGDVASFVKAYEALRATIQV